MQPSPPVAVVGMSSLFAGSHDLLGFWRDIVSATDRLSDVPAAHWLIEDYYDPDPSAPDMTYVKRGGFLDPLPFNPMEFGLPPTTIPATDSAQLLALIAAKRVLEDAGRFHEGADHSRTSVILGVASATELVVQMGSRLQHPIWKKALRDAGLPESRVQDIIQRIKDHYQPWQESTFPGLLGNVVAGRIANRLNLGGSNYVTDAACASSLSALKAGLAELYLGDSDTVIAGGVDALNDILMYMCFSKTPAFSPTGDCRPFSEDADGTLIGEGVGMLALRRLEDAERDGDPIYAVIRGLGSSSDGKGSSVYAPRPEGQAGALRRAYERAGYSPATVELVEAHGTATKAGDAAEAEGLSKVFERGEGGEDQWCALGSVKSQIGHTKAAAGSAGLIKVALALHHKILPPTLKVAKPSQKLGLEDSPLYINTEARPWIRGKAHPRRGSVSSFGFGGSNFHVAVEEYVGAGRRPERLRTWAEELVLLSARDATGLSEALDGLTERIEAGHPLGLLAHDTAASFDAGAGARLALVAASLDELSGKIERARSALAAGKTDGLPDADVMFGFGAPDGGETAFLFPGQGSQYVGMGAAAAMAFDGVRRVWDEAADMEVFAGDRLDRAVFPRPAFSDEERAAQERAVTRMTTAQPAIAAVSLGYLDILRTVGLTPDAVAGHSFGELTALAAAGRIAEDNLLATARRRGELMAEAADGRPGAMIAVAADVEALRPFVDGADDVVVANDNAPGEVVLAGPVAAIDEMEQRLGAEGLRTIRLPVASAFHSEIVADSCEPFHTHLETVSFADGRVPVYANKTASAYPEGADEARRILADQLASPVRFREMIEAMYEAGVTRFVEVGPGRVLTKLVDRCLGERPHVAVALDDKRGRGLRALWRGLGRLAADGVALDLQALTAGYRVPEAPVVRKGFEVLVSGANNDKPYPPADGAAGLPAPNPEQAEHPQPVLPPTAAQASSPVAPAADRYAADAPSPSPASVPPSPAPTSRPSNGAAQSMPAPAAPAAPARPSLPARPHSMTPDDSIRRAAIDAHERYMELMAESHQAFLRMAGGALGAPTGAAVSGHEYPSPAPRQTGRPAPAAPQPAAAASQPAAAPSQPAAAPPQQSVASTPQPAAAAAQPAAPAQQPAAAPPQPVAATSRPAAATPAPVASQPTPAPASAPAVDVTALALEVVSEKTGYPVEMLDLDMEMEAGLGIDSIKQVEILSELQERIPGVPEIQPSELAGLRTLRDVADKLSSAGAAAAVGSVAAGGAAVGATGAATAGAAGASAEPSGATQPAAGVAPSGATAVDVTALALEVVSEKTGYPVEMLDLDMEMEAGLGIDSIKQVEILSELQERIPGVPEIQPSELAGLRTLRDVADKLSSAGAAGAAAVGAGAAGSAAAGAIGAGTASMGDPAAPPAASQPPGGAAPTGGAAVDVTALALEVVSEKTGYPVEMLDLDMEMEAGLGIDSIKQVEILSELQERIPGVPEIQPSELAGLRTLRDVADKLSTPVAGTPGNDAEAAPAPGTGPAPVDVPAEDAPGEAAAPSDEPSVEEEPYVPTVSVFAPRILPEDRPGFGLAALRPGVPVEVTGEHPALAGALVAALTARGYAARVVDAPSTPSAAVVCLAALAEEAAGPEASLSVHTRAIDAARAVAAHPEATERLFVTVQSTGGDFGLASDPAQGAWAAGVAGVVKTAAREWPDASVKAIDVADPDTAAEHVVEELLLGGPALEVGLAADGTRSVVRVEPLRARELDGPALEPGAVVVVSGGARGVTAASVRRLAGAWGVRLVLMGRSRLAEWPEGVPLTTDVIELTASLAAGARDRGESIDLPSLQRRARSLAATAEVRTTLAEMEARGIEATYVSADVSDPAQVAEALAGVRERWGPIRGIVHGAGVLRDKALAGMTPDRVAEVFAPKVRGLSVLLDATREDPVGLIAMFSSVAARAGNAGQSAYAAANEVLNKVAAAEAHRRGGECRVRSYNWGPWDGGMVDDGLAAHFEKQGIPLLSEKDGAAFFVRDLGRAGGSVERLVLAAPSFPGRAQRFVAPAGGEGDDAERPDLRDPAVAADAALRLGHALRPVATMRVLLEDFVIAAPGGGTRSGPAGDQAVAVHPLDEGGPGHRVVFSDGEGRVHHEVVLRYAEAGSVPPPEVPSGGLEPWSLDADPGSEAVLDSVGGERSILNLEGVSAEGGMALLRNLAPSWAKGPDLSGGFSPALFAGLLQLGTLWTHQRSGAAQTLARMGTMVVHHLEGIPERVRSAFRARQTERGTLFDFVLATEDGDLVAQLHEVQFEAPGV